MLLVPFRPFPSRDEGRITEGATAVKAGLRIGRHLINRRQEPRIRRLCMIDVPEHQRHPRDRSLILSDLVSEASPMRKVVVCSLAILAFLAVRPASAGNVYVPIVERDGPGGTTVDTEILVSNGGLAQRSFVSTFLAGETDGTQRDGIPSSSRVRLGAGAASRLSNTAPATKFGLLEIDAAPQLLVEAEIAASGHGEVTVAPVPVISSANMFTPPAVADVLGLRRQDAVYSDLFVANLAKSAAQCVIQLVRADGAELKNATVTVQPLSLRRFGDVLAEQQLANDVRARVFCNQNFFPFAAVVDPTAGRIVFRDPATLGTSTLTGPTGTPPVPPGTVVFSAPGVLLVPSPTEEVRIVRFPLAKTAEFKQLIFDLDITVGPWNAGLSSGPHAVVWLHRGKYGSDTFANVNIHGPDKNKLRAVQNLDLTGFGLTTGDQQGVYEPGHTYHYRMIYDAVAQRARQITTEGSRVVNDFAIEGTAKDHKIIVDTRGLTAVLGHASGLPFEVTSYGWTYANMQIELVPF